MVITWYGRGCFKIQSGSVESTLLIDPYHPNAKRRLSRSTPDVVTLTSVRANPEWTSARTDEAFLIQYPGEYEAHGIFVTALRAHKKAVGMKGSPQTTLLCSFGVDEMSLVHLGDVDRTLTENELDALGRVDILLLPIGGGTSLDAHLALEVLKQVEPRIIVPCMYRTGSDDVDLTDDKEFLKEYGIKDVEHTEKLKLSKKDLPAEESRVILLKSCLV